MDRMRLLQLNYVHLRGGYEHLFKKLRWLCWHGFPLNSIPTNFNMEKLVVLDMQHSHIKEVWEEIKVLKRLKILNLSHSCYLTKTPNFSGLLNLEELILEGCRRLIKVHPSIGLLQKLVILNLKDCNNLLNLPSSICKLGSLRRLNLSGCSQSTQLQSKSWFSFFQYWGSLRRKPEPITLLPASLSGLCSLRDLNLSNCNLSEDMIPNDFRSLSSSLAELDLTGNRFFTLPASICHLSRLGCISLNDCRNLQVIPNLPSRLRTLNIEECTSLEELPANISDLFQLDCDASMLPNKSRDIPCPETSQSGVHWELEVWGSGSEIPEWIDHQNIGSKISFEVSPHPGCKIKGLDVAAVFDNDVRLAVMANLLIYNKTEGIQLERWNRSYRNVFICQSTHALWVCYIPLSRLYGFFGAEVIEAHLEVGDQVEISVEIMTWKGRVDVEKCGVHLVHELDEEEIQSDNDRSLTQYMSVSNDDVAVDGGPTVANMENENKRGYIEDVLESTVIPKD
ncbi:disease resistance protein RPV1-like [Macadamia integrifolia]|uniref:disease resistance protein RPV1-like n=1 Tax=Macadamia integrifolia TaxID=60698 RepID=UPI001C528A2A|nr:disease resistance protein RPV1-like [Macadamia integrifolia]